MKFACFADLHCHKFKDFDVATDFTGSRRLDLILSVLENIRRYCVANGIKHVLCAGDLYNTRAKLDVEVQNHLHDALSKFGDSGIAVIIIAGNHDQVDNSELPQNALHVLKDLPGIVVFDDVGTLNVKDRLSGEEILIHCIPYNKNAVRLKEAILDFVSGDKGRNSVLLAHLGVSGGFQGCNSYPLADAFNLEDLHPEYFKYVVLGHYHKRQFLGGTNNTFYCGAPIQHSHNDEGEEKGFYVIDTSKRCDVCFVPLPNPVFKTITAETTQEELADHAHNGDYLRVRLKEDEVQEFITQAPQDLKYKTEIEKVYKEETRVDVKIGMGFEQIISTYAEEFMPDAKQVGIDILREVEGSK